MQTLINSQIVDFKVQAFADGQFKTVTRDDLRGKWSIFFFYPADFTFVCPTELGDMADKYETFRKMGVEVYSVSTDTHFSIRLGMTLRIPSRRSSTPCSPIPQAT